ncbi:MAG: hypothetical protein EBU82_13945, partial [Flavobacteriia bacterium]|nr:hypothetical protein [Flavobacteriia bacterium]
MAVTSVNLNSVNVSSAQGFSVGDRVLLIQMKGATISSTNNASFGQIQNYGNAGNFEFTNIAAINGTTITFVQNLCRTFTVSGLVQLIRVPVYNQVTIVGTLTALPWNGTIGGVVAIEATGGITFNANLDVQGQGFVGGTWTNGFFACGDPNFANSGNTAGKKGEGIAAAPMNMDGNRAPLANGGGGSNSGNPGAGGGSNGGAGGRGGNEFLGWCAVNGSFGLGGYSLNYSTYRAFLGGGGGGGYRDNGLTATNGFFACGDANYANSGNTAGKKGEGIVAAPLNMDGNRAPLANGGGGSNSGNPGAGGGSNGGAGGRGGNEFLGWCAVNGSFGLG